MGANFYPIESLQTLEFISGTKRAIFQTTCKYEQQLPPILSDVFDYRCAKCFCFLSGLSHLRVLGDDNLARWLFFAPCPLRTWRGKEFSLQSSSGLLVHVIMNYIRYTTLDWPGCLWKLSWVRGGTKEHQGEGQMKIQNVFFFFFFFVMSQTKRKSPGSLQSFKYDFEIIEFVFFGHLSMVTFCL